MVLFFTSLCSPVVLCQISLPRWVADPLRHPRQIPWLSSYLSFLKFWPVGKSNVIVYKTSPPTSWGGECDILVYSAYQFLTWEPEEDWLVSLWTFFLSLCFVCWDRKKKKKEWLFLIGAVVSFLFVDNCHFPGCPSLSCYCTVGCLRGGTCMSLLESSVGASLLHSLLNLILFMYLLRPEALHLASSPFLWGADRMVPVPLSSKVSSCQWEPNTESTSWNTEITSCSRVFRQFPFLLLR